MLNSARELFLVLPWSLAGPLGLPVLGWLAGLAGLAGLDAMAALQLMVSRPLVLGWAVGLLLGDPTAGLTLGCLLELLWINVLPVGAFVPPDLQFSSLFTVAGTLLLRQQPGWTLGVTLPEEAIAVWMILVSIPLALFSGLAELKLRRLNVLLAHWVDRRVEARHPGAVSWALAASMSALFLKNALLALVSLSVLVPLSGLLLASLPAPALQGLAWMYWLVLLLGLLLVLDLFWNRLFLSYGIFSFLFTWLFIHLLHVPLHWVLPLALLLALSAFLTRLGWGAGQGATG